MDKYYLEYEIDNGARIILAFDEENDRDGCHISLDMYKAQLGPVTEDVFTRIREKFRGEILGPRT
jgi:hypothetical protein